MVVMPGLLFAGFILGVVSYYGMLILFQGSIIPALFFAALIDFVLVAFIVGAMC